MKRTIILLALIVLSMPAAAFSQIRLPKLTLPKKPDIKTSDDAPTGGPAMQKQAVIDDGFTFFDAEPVEEYNAQLARKVSTGWHLRSSLRMFGTAPNRSGFYLDVSKAGKVLARIRCEGTAYRKAEDPVPEYRNAPEPDYLMTDQRGCEDKTKVIKETGKLDVSVIFFNGSTDEERSLRTYKIDVREAKRIRGLATAPVPDVSHFYIQRHAETSAAILFIRPIKDGRLPPNYFRIAGEGDYHTEVEIYFNYSPLKQVDRLKELVTRCSVNGAPVNFPGTGSNSDAARPRLMRVETAIYTDRLAPQYKRANEYMDEVSFAQYQLRLPLLRRNDPANNRLGMFDRKGNWECSVRLNGETLRTFRWVVGNSGVAVHPEQASGNVNLNYNAYLIEAEVPAGGSSIDHRLMPLPSDGFFYGIQWRSAEGKAAAAKVPTKGSPYHKPSTAK